ncbi:Oxygen regulatory protein NreC [compost metagenome]
MSVVTSRNAESAPTAPPAHTIRVAMVEDDAACRLALDDAVGIAPGLCLVWAAASRREALEQLQNDAPLDVLLVDLGLPDGSGLEVIAAARSRWPLCSVMVSTMFGDEMHVLRAIAAGAMGYVLKDLSASELVTEIRSLHAGGSPINPLVARKLLLRQAAQPATPMAVAEAPALTTNSVLSSPPSAREAQVLSLVARGHTVEEVAGVLGVSPHTVQTFVRRIYTKLQVHSRAEAVREAARQGWLHGD